MKTAILTDSNSGLTQEEAARRDIFLLPMPVILDGKEYFEGVNLSHREFYQNLQDGADASTSQPSPGEVLAMFDRILDSGYDELVYIPMSSGLSFSCQTARLLSEEYEGKVWVADTHRVSITLHDCVLNARALAEQGRSGREIREILEQSALDSVIYLGVDTLKYFRKNGRCTAAAAAMSSVIGLKPLLRCDGGSFEACAKVRGVKNCQQEQLKRAKEAADALRTQGEPLYIGISDSFTRAEDSEAWAAQVQEAFPDDLVHYEPLPFSVICHTGLNAFGMGISRAAQAK